MFFLFLGNKFKVTPYKCFNYNSLWLLFRIHLNTHSHIDFELYYLFSSHVKKHIAGVENVFYYMYEPLNYFFSVSFSASLRYFNLLFNQEKRMYYDKVFVVIQHIVRALPSSTQPPDYHKIVSNYRTLSGRYEQQFHYFTNTNDFLTIFNSQYFYHRWQFIIRFEYIECSTYVRKWWYNKYYFQRSSSFKLNEGLFHVSTLLARILSIYISVSEVRFRMWKVLFIVFTFNSIVYKCLIRILILFVCLFYCFDGFW